MLRPALATLRRHIVGIVQAFGYHVLNGGHYPSNAKRPPTITTKASISTTRRTVPVSMLSPNSRVANSSLSICIDLASSANGCGVPIRPSSVQRPRQTAVPKQPRQRAGLVYHAAKTAGRRKGERGRMPRAQNRNRHDTEAASLRIVARVMFPVAFDLRQEPGAGKPHAGICAGARSNSRPCGDRLSRTRWR
jgi:hypothetical protein